MRRTGRRTLTIISLIACLATLALWAWSLHSKSEFLAFRMGPLYVDLHSEDASLACSIVHTGEIKILSGQNLPPTDGRSSFRWPSLGVQWQLGKTPLFWTNHDPFWLVTLRLPNWLIVLLTAILPLLWLRKHLHPPDPQAILCIHCGYDLRATPGRCPECGAAPGQGPSPHTRRNIALITLAVLAACYLAVAGYSPREWNRRGWGELLAHSVADHSPPPNIDLPSDKDLCITISDGGHFTNFDTLRIAPDGTCLYVFYVRDRIHWTFKRTTFRLDRGTHDSLKALLRDIRFPQLDRRYSGDLHDGRQLYVAVRSGTSLKNVTWDNYFPANAQRLCAFRDDRILAAHRREIADAEALCDSREPGTPEQYEKIRQIEDEAEQDIQ